jgi:hypothetical protein
MIESDVSVTLRRANVQNFIIQLICERLWKPLFSESLWGNQNAQSYLEKISSVLDSTGLQRESLWRHTTLKFTEKGFGRPVTREEILKNLTKDVLAKLQPLVEPTQSDELSRELRNLFDIAIEFWCNAQKDGSRISTVMKPDKTNADRWTDALPEFPASGVVQQSSSSNSDKDYSALLLFPTIIRISLANPPLGTDGHLLSKQDCVLLKGCALFPDTTIFSQGAQEKAEIEQEIEQDLKEMKLEIQRKSRSQRTNGNKRHSIASSAAQSPILRQS